MSSVKGRVHLSVPLLIEPAFLTARDCDRLRAAMDRGVDEPAEIVGNEIAPREAVRQTRTVEIDTALREWFEHRLDTIKPVIEHALNQHLGDREGCGFLRYPPGGFYRAHRDRANVAGWPPAARRAASVVVFLNGSTATAGLGSFEGGVLCLHPTRGERTEIRPTPGLLVAFPSTVLHEVLPVRNGERDAVVDWFYDAELGTDC
jgi:predicted 2-oxoglutarate/Fe(II)-dependent dioxygenase YbiX